MHQRHASKCNCSVHVYVNKLGSTNMYHQHIRLHTPHIHDRQRMNPNDFGDSQPNFSSMLSFPSSCEISHFLDGLAQNVADIHCTQRIKPIDRVVFEQPVFICFSDVLKNNLTIP